VRATFQHSAMRYPEQPGRPTNTIGFRVARTVR
jgi:hypothetical protein